MMRRSHILAAVLLCMPLMACGGASETKPAEGEEAPAAADYERGPHNGRMLRDGPLIGLLDSSEGAVQAAAARALSAYPSREAVDKLSDMLTAENPDTRAMAAYSLGKINNPAVAGALYNAMPDRSWSVRYHCAAALKRLGAPGAEYLNKALSHSDPYVADIAKYVISLPYFALV